MNARSGTGPEPGEQRRVQLHAEAGMAGAVLFVHLALSPVVFSHATAEHFELNKLALLVLAVLAVGALWAGEMSFREWRWEPLASTPALIVPFKQPVYQRVAQEFARFARRS